MLQGVSFLDSNNINGHRCNQLTTVLFSLADALTLIINTMAQMVRISCLLNFAFGFVNRNPNYGKLYIYNLLG